MILREELRRAIGRAVVDDQAFELVERDSLSLQAAQDQSERGAAIQDGNDNAEAWVHVLPSSIGYEDIERDIVRQQGFQLFLRERRDPLQDRRDTIDIAGVAADDRLAQPRDGRFLEEQAEQRHLGREEILKLRDELCRQQRVPAE